jgi:hypothetical protein
MVSLRATGPTVVGSGPAEDGRSGGGGVKPSGPCHRFMACKRTLQSMSVMLCRPNFPTPVSHP